MILARAISLVGALLLLAPAWSGAESPGRQLHAEPSPLATLIELSPGMQPEGRLDLASLLIDRLAQAYEAELEQALAQLERDGASRESLARWYRATAPILAELHEWQAAVYAAGELAFSLDRHDQVLLRVDGRPLWVAWPRLSARSRLERELAAEFCARRECPPELVVGGAAAVPAEPTGGAWRLSQFDPPTWQGDDGVACEFSDFSQLGARERLCRDLSRDLHVLAVALRTAERGGERIEWRSLSLAGTTRDGRHRVAVNARGDHVLVYVPSLAQQNIDWLAAGRWLQARVEGRDEPATVLRSGR